MTTPDSSKEVRQVEEGGFPIQAKLLLGIIILGVVALVLKAVGLF